MRVRRGNYWSFGRGRGIGRLWAMYCWPEDVSTARYIDWKVIEGGRGEQGMEKRILVVL